MPKYVYQPLDKPDSEFRLLRIHKDPVTHQPQCTLHKYRLTTCPDYIALSYTWGEPTPTHTIEIDGADLEVRQNLFDFLHACITEVWGMNGTREIRAVSDDGMTITSVIFEKPVFYWVDQICINQDDVIERSDQVCIMDKIYKQAKMVLLWLGCEPNMIEAARRLRDEEGDKGEAATTLASHPYFSRIWIIQEIALSSKPPFVVCGGIELNWCRIPFWRVGQERISREKANVLSFGRGSDRKKRTLENCISTHCGSNCHDPRDKVYGLLGLTAQQWRVRVDYTKTVHEVYFDAVAALYEELFDLEDPECLYPERLTVMARPYRYRYTLVVLAISMGVTRRHDGGLWVFLEHIQAAYLSTKTRNFQYTYTGRIYTRVHAESSSEQFLASEEEEEEFEVKWGSITATRRNPLMRDIIPEMGLQFASTTADSTAEQSGDSVSVVDRWWCKHNGEIHYFNCLE